MFMIAPLLGAPACADYGASDEPDDTLGEASEDLGGDVDAERTPAPSSVTQADVEALGDTDPMAPEDTAERTELSYLIGLPGGGGGYCEKKCDCDCKCKKGKCYWKNCDNSKKCKKDCKGKKCYKGDKDDDDDNDH
jgi:hypothetical protein